MPSFTQDLTNFVAKTKVNGALVVKKLAFDAFAGVLRRSPVDTGRFRGSWRIAVDQTDLSVAPADPKVPAPDGGALANAKLGGVKWGQSVMISNNLPYGPALENGHSGQAPQGVLKITFAEVIGGFARVVQKVTGI